MGRGENEEAVLEAGRKRTVPHIPSGGSLPGGEKKAHCSTETIPDLGERTRCWSWGGVLQDAPGQKKLKGSRGPGGKGDLQIRIRRKK